MIEVTRKTYNVFLRGKLIETLGSFSSDPEYVRQLLVREGYHPEIDVRRSYQAAEARA
ncbi:hypothetical protein [Sphingomonas sp.]|jgi:hypothetical protein|uniref:hypothetical protein n=1 Tax=Sphingomonas sp. TaxID=28214 RepID=UPI0035617A0D